MVPNLLEFPIIPGKSVATSICVTIHQLKDYSNHQPPQILNMTQFNIAGEQSTLHNPQIKIKKLIKNYIFSKSVSRKAYRGTAYHTVGCLSSLENS